MKSKYFCFCSVIISLSRPLRSSSPPSLWSTSSPSAQPTWPTVSVPLVAGGGQPVLVSRLQEASTHRPELHLLPAAEERAAARALDAARRRAALRLQVIQTLLFHRHGQTLTVGLCCVSLRPPHRFHFELFFFIRMF